LFVYICIYLFIFDMNFIEIFLKFAYKLDTRLSYIFYIESSNTCIAFFLKIYFDKENIYKTFFYLLIVKLVTS